MLTASIFWSSGLRPFSRMPGTSSPGWPKPALLNQHVSVPSALAASAAASRSSTSLVSVATKVPAPPCASRKALAVSAWLGRSASTTWPPRAIHSAALADPMPPASTERGARRIGKKGGEEQAMRYGEERSVA